MSQKEYTAQFARILTEGLSLGIIVVDSEYRITYWNPWLERHSNVKAADVIGQNIFERYPDIQKRKKDRFLIDCVERKRPIFLSPFLHHYFIPLHISKEDQSISMLQQTKIFPVISEDDSSGAIIIIEDFTEQFLHEKEISRLTRILKGIRNVNQLIVTADSEDELYSKTCKILVEDSGYLFVWIGLVQEGSFQVKPVSFGGFRSEMLTDLHVTWDDSVYSRSATGKAIMTGNTHVVHSIPEDPEYEPWRELAKEMGTQSACSVPLKTGKDVIGALTVHHGQPHIFGEEELQLLEEVAGDISFAIRSLRDRRERYEAERRVAASEKQYRNLVEAMSDGLAMHDEKGVFTYVNDSICEISGYSKDEILGEAVFDFLDDTNGRIFKEKMKLEKKGQREIYELAFTKKDGQKIPMNISPAPLFNEKGHYEGSLAIITDISEKKQLEDQLRQSQKMEAVATLAGGIAHDFNIILASIIGYAELTEQDVADNAPARENLEEVQRGGYRARDLVKQILTFSRQVESERIPMRPRPVIEETLKLLRSTIPTTIEFSEKIDTSARILGDQTQVQQVIMNLCTNAYHAMREEGGILDVSLSSFELDSKSAPQYPGLSPGPYVKLVVSDTGCGMDDATRRRIFDPYFTTKKKGEGTGLGLSMVHGIVKGHGGEITVYSEPGIGTTFVVYLPSIEQMEESATTETEQPIPRGTEHILFVDDEQSIVDMNIQRLERLGYRVTARTSSLEALELFKKQPDQFDLVITDMTMPKMAGHRFAEEVMKIRPDIPVILCTGFSEQISKEKAKAMGIKAYAMKPLVLRDMANIIRRVLDEK